MLDKWHSNLFTHQGFMGIDEIEDELDKKGKKNIKKVKNKVKILENDLTKALINTIIYSKKAKGVFINLLKKKRIKIGKKYLSEENIDLFTSKVEKNPKSVLLLIKSKYVRELEEGEEKETTILDAIIRKSKSNIGIESKLKSYVDMKQIKREKKLLGINKKPVEIYWEDIYQKMKEKLKKNKKNKNNKKNKEDIILKNFVEFLEVAGMTGFTGIPFALQEGVAEENYTEEKAKEILKKIKYELENEFKNNDKLKGLNIGKGKEINWTKIQEKDKKEPHYSIYVFPQYFGMDLFFNKIDKERIKSIINKITSKKIFLDKNKRNDKTWFIQLEKWRGYRANKEEMKEFYQSQDTHNYPVTNFIFSLPVNIENILRFEDDKKKNKKKNKKNNKKNNKVDFDLKIERRFYYDNPFYTTPYKDKNAKGNKIIKIKIKNKKNPHMNSPKFYSEVISETLKKLRKIRKDILKN